ncbi:MAG: membrane dipeptidase [Acidobacteriales bacterium]|nr:membrane dipeptidase [Candidatus Koribacter versatilis]MBI3646829.1 membrane dipeptidase [Terriglobales bacterium]
MRHSISLLALALSLSLFTQAQTSDAGVSAKARQIHDSALVVDTHADTPQRFLDENYDIGSTDPKDHGHISLDKAKAGNLGAEFFSIWVEPETNQGHFARHTLDLIDAVYEQAARHPDRMVMAFSVDDIERAHKQKKLAALMGIEGGHSIENDVRVLRAFYRLGIRYMTLSWSNTNEWADSSGDINNPKVEHHNGLTDGGKQIVLEMNRLGMLVDISHVTDKTFYDVIAVTKAPVIASHSCARALTNHPRNMTDDMLRAVARNGGVVQVNFYNAFIDEDYRKAAETQMKDRDAALKTYMDQRKTAGQTVTYLDADRIEREWAAKVPRPPLKSLIDHIDHVAKVAGIDHVGLGSDFDGVSGATPQGIDSAADLPKITQALLDRGYSAGDIKKILGGNLLRVFREAERVSREMQAATQH